MQGKWFSNICHVNSTNVYSFFGIKQALCLLQGCFWVAKIILLPPCFCNSCISPFSLGCHSQTRQEAQGHSFLASLVETLAAHNNWSTSVKCMHWIFLWKLSIVLILKINLKASNGPFCLDLFSKVFVYKCFRRNILGFSKHVCSYT